MRICVVKIKLQTIGILLVERGQQSVVTGEGLVRDVHVRIELRAQPNSWCQQTEDVERLDRIRQITAECQPLKGAVGDRPRRARKEHVLEEWLRSDHISVGSRGLAWQAGERAAKAPARKMAAGKGILKTPNLPPSA